MFPAVATMRLTTIKQKIISLQCLRYYAKACNKWRGPSPRQCDTAPKKRQWRAVGDTVSRQYKTNSIKYHLPAKRKQTILNFSYLQNETSDFTKVSPLFVLKCFLIYCGKTSCGKQRCLRPLQVIYMIVCV